ncbi:50S ribosomal protein L4 [Helicobacter baculiformis]|uniref:Large ribosomal subunit protein uL4 n=1 Tax=Helicobacter baculiformis TaxID=427351 RepID=A0ABV7ZFS5_9HELI|nr:50S ribosomal protein L4 [Helicobacter baculiformis]
MKARVLNQQCEQVGELDLPARFKEIKEHNLYLYVKYYRAQARANSAQTKNRGAVSGGGKKPWNQKGGGRARAGSITSPIFVGGGVSHGATNERNYDLKINKKQKKLALEYALGQKALAEKLLVVDKVDIISKKTKDAYAFLQGLKQRDVLVITEQLQEHNYLAFRNLKSCYVVETSEVNAYLVATYSAVVVEKAVFEALVTA